MTRTAALFAALLLANLAAWAWAGLAFHGDAVLMGTAALAYSLGLRHAVDADHITAIDNVTRKLMNEGQRPLTAGLWFSLGHASVVWLASLGIGLGAASLAPHLKLIDSVGGALGTWVSALFLFGIAGANLLVLRGVVAAVKCHKRGETPSESELSRLLGRRGFYSRLLAPVLRLTAKSRQMYLVGLLFGLGFDTATEIGVLAISAAASAHGLPLASILVFPALFTAGMALLDTADSALMVGAYGWAFVDPGRKLYYNLTVTFFSVVVAFVVGGLEIAGFVAERLNLPGAAGALTQAANAHPGLLGSAVVAMLALAWLVSTLALRRRQARG
ncbi:MAG: HoxN/HupN/NixA family nickel/cobalt transporter [Alphaproteobacteria bacterium]|nr:HoxN/HupN/NixA family nickel/cobalt transporter [Alphaproteobacteria bacterium]